MKETREHPRRILAGTPRAFRHRNTGSKLSLAASPQVGGGIDWASQRHRKRWPRVSIGAVLTCIHPAQSAALCTESDHLLDSKATPCSITNWRFVIPALDLGGTALYLQCGAGQTYLDGR